MIAQVEISLNVQSKSEASHNIDPMWAHLNKDYRLVEMIGQGGMGDVYLTQKRSAPLEGKLYALKVVRNPPMSRTEPSEIPTEVHIMAHLLTRHNFFVNFTAGFGMNNTWMMLIEYCPEGDLEALNLQYLRSGRRLPEAFIWHVFLSAAKAVYSAHRRGIIHRDIKPSNFLLKNRDDEGKYPDVKLADWGVAALKSDPGYKVYTRAGTSSFRRHDDPILADEKCDVWAVGASIHCLMFDNTPPNRYPKADNGQYSRMLYDAMRDCVEFCHAKRLSSLELVRKIEKLAPSRIERGYQPLR